MISPVSGHFAQYRIIDAQTNANGAITFMNGTFSGRSMSVAARLSAIRLIGPVRYEITVATEITAASELQPRKKNRKMNDTSRLNHIAGRGTPYSGCTLPKIFGIVLLRSIA